MIDLQTGLIAGGVGFVLVIFGYNKWHEYKVRKLVERAFSSDLADVLMDVSNTAPAIRHEPSLGEDTVLADKSRNLPTHVAGIKELPIDTLIDCSINLLLDHPVRGERMLPLVQGLRFIGNKSVHWIGQMKDGQWEVLCSGSSYVSLQVAVQMANRSSALSELEFSEWVSAVRKIGDEIGAEAISPDMVDVMERARSLYKFVHEHDAQLNLNVLSNGAAWSLSTLMFFLEKHGLSSRPDGRMVRLDETGTVIFSLNLNAIGAKNNTNRLSLFLNVPVVVQERNGFSEIVTFAKTLAQKLDGKIVDDEGRELSDDALAEIALEVEEFYAQMASATILAGSCRALRLYDK